MANLREDLGEVASTGKLPLDVFTLVIPEASGEGFEGGPALSGQNNLSLFDFLVSPVASRGLGELNLRDGRHVVAVLIAESAVVDVCTLFDAGQPACKGSRDAWASP